MQRYSVAIIGGSGYVGNALAKHFSKSYEVIIVDNRPCPSVFSPSVSCRLCDIRNYSQVREALQGSDLVIHTAIVQIPQIIQEKRLGYEVNLLGTQNICRAVDEIDGIRGMILASSWHTIGERELGGTIDEEFGFRPDKVESRARLYALSKIGQEVIVRFYDEMSTRTFGIVRMGTVLGAGMPKDTAASLFIEKGLKGEPLTPFKHSLYRPMLYVDIEDICMAFEVYARKLLAGEMGKQENSLSHIVNVYYPQPISILELSEIVSKSIAVNTAGKIAPAVEIIDRGLPPSFSPEDKLRLNIRIDKAQTLLGITHLKSPAESIDALVRCRLGEAV